VSPAPPRRSEERRGQEAADQATQHGGTV
jgi:hypothetical protein